MAVGHIVPGGAADLDGRLRTGDEILFCDGVCVINSSHHKVVQLMGNAGFRGQVSLGVRRRIALSSGKIFCICSRVGKHCLLCDQKRC